MENQISEQKELLRKKMRAKIREWIEQNDLAQNSKSACKKIFSLDEYQKSEILLAYIPMKNEADCISVILDAMKSGKKTAVPKCASENGKMEFYFLKNDLPLENQLEKGNFGIFEPKDFLKRFDFENKKSNSLKETEIFMLVPGLAFTKDGKRLGKGKGFYDRYFERLEKFGLKNIFRCGFCFPCQIVDEIPCGEFDRKVDKCEFARQACADRKR